MSETLNSSLTPEAPDSNSSLQAWLNWLEVIHPKSIDMGLQRVGRVADRLTLRSINKPLVLVAGTNGKGSTVAMLEAIYQRAGYRVGAYTSPHISNFCERISVNSISVSERKIVEAFAEIEQHRLPDTLTYFEYATLAAMLIFIRSDCDIYLLEVGLGGRLDATNIWDADCAVLTSVALDHQDYLGSDLAVIATEKAAIGRPGKTLVVGEVNPPGSLTDYAEQHNLRLNWVGGVPAEELPDTSLVGEHQHRNAACALAVVADLQRQLPVSEPDARSALLSLSVDARFELATVNGTTVVLDVAHNPAGALALVGAWRKYFNDQQAQILFACLGDKDLAGIVEPLKEVVSRWHCVALHENRAVEVADLAKQIKPMVEQPVDGYLEFNDAWLSALSHAAEAGEPVLVAGSFYTIALAKANLAGG